MNLRRRTGIIRPKPVYNKDIILLQDNIYIGSIINLTYSITREMTPIYTLGSTEPVSFGRGHRDIAGTFVLKTLVRGMVLPDRPFSIEIPKDDLMGVAHSILTGCELTNEGSSKSLYDAEVGIQQTFVAREIE